MTGHCTVDLVPVHGHPKGLEGAQTQKF